MPYNKFYNEPMNIEPAGTAVADLFGRMIAAQQMRLARERQRELDAQAQIDADRKRTAEDEERALRVADLRSKIAASTSLTDLPQVEKTVDEGSFTNPEEAAYMSGTAAMEGKPVEPGFLKLGTVQTTIPVAPRTQSFTLGGESFTTPLRYREDLEADAARAFDTKLDQESQLAEARDVGVMIPNDPDRYGEFAGRKVPKSLAAVLVKPPTDRDPSYREVVINGRRTMATGRDIEKAIASGATVHEYDKPTGGSGSSKLEWFLDTDTGEEVLLPAEQAAAAGSGRYRRPLFAAPTAELERARRSLSAMVDLNTSLEDVTTKVGPVNYTLNELYRKVPGFDADPAFRAFQQQLNALSNEEIKRITGAQMSESEAERLKKGMADGSLKLDDLRTAMYVWNRALQRTEASLTGRLDAWQKQNPYRLPAAGSKNRRVGPDGRTYEKVVGGWKAVQ